ncbi:GRP family sugar transporter [uncultured Victivallis sp.]|uniref:GRP family sugar transporter n=1 Tax=uncultured Victivallis sp. TaxID=354118 RepID=UPI0025E56824|nr:GRP family sugar transporter [uncultured Victivallis sp.]
MTISAFLLVFASVFLHAGWNFLSKKKIPSLAFYCIMSSTSAVMWLPFFLCSGLIAAEPPVEFWLIWLGSVGCELLYLCGLAHAYRTDDISLVYPLARALPVMMTAFLTLCFGYGRPPGPTALAGMVILSVGCVLMPLTRWDQFRFASYRSPALKFIVMAALGTTGYTILDSLALKVLYASIARPGWIDSCAYLFLIEAGLAVSQLVVVSLSRVERNEFKKLFLKSKSPVFSGIFASTAYILILFAMERVSNVSYLQAFRQMSLPLGVLAGIFLLHERPGRPRLAGIALVVTGLAVTALGS